MTALSVILQKTVAEGKVTIPCKSYSEANNLRQRFYRHREAIRKEADNPLNLVVDKIHFIIDDRKLILEYDDKDEKLLEAINDDKDTGASAPNESNQSDDVSSRQRQRSQTG